MCLDNYLQKGETDIIESQPPNTDATEIEKDQEEYLNRHPYPLLPTGDRVRWDGGANMANRDADEDFDDIDRFNVVLGQHEHGDDDEFTTYLEDRGE